MLKKFFVTIVFLVQTVASAAPTELMAFKDFKLTSVNEKITELEYKGEKMTIERVGDLHFKFDDKDVIFKKTDTFEAVYAKIDGVYRSTRKKTASLDSLLLPRSHAVVPPLVAGAFALFAGLAIGTSVGKNKCEKQYGTAGSTGSGAPTYDAPVSVQ
jgi:hypothetical protein